LKREVSGVLAAPSSAEPDVTLLTSPLPRGAPGGRILPPAQPR
jgi:hypothetical protein